MFKTFKLSPDETLKIVQELYEKKLVTYPRTDARVLSTAVSKEIYKNINGLTKYPLVSEYAQDILQGESYKGISRTRYVNDKQITDHYAIIPTGQGLGALKSVNLVAQKIYEVVVRRFLCIFYPPAEYMKTTLVVKRGKESFFTNFKVLVKQGYLELATASFAKSQNEKKQELSEGNTEQEVSDEDLINMVKQLKKGMEVTFDDAEIKEGETSAAETL